MFRKRSTEHRKRVWKNKGHGEVMGSGVNDVDGGEVLSGAKGVLANEARQFSHVIGAHQWTRSHLAHFIFIFCWSCLP